MPTKKIVVEASDVGGRTRWRGNPPRDERGSRKGPPSGFAGTVGGLRVNRAASAARLPEYLSQPNRVSFLAISGGSFFWPGGVGRAKCVICSDTVATL